MEIEDLIVGGEYEYDLYDRSNSNWTPVIVKYIGKSNIILSLEDDSEMVIKPENLTHIREKKQVVKVSNPLSVIEYLISECVVEEQPLIEVFDYLPEETLYRLVLRQNILHFDAKILTALFGVRVDDWMEMDKLYQENKGDK